MTPEDRELLHDLRRRQLELQRSLARLDVQLDELEARASAAAPAESPPDFPPLPPPHVEMPVLPHDAAPPPLPPLPVVEPSLHELPPLPIPPPPPVQAPKLSFEFQFGRWLTGLGALFGVITLGLIFSWTHAAIYKLLGPAGILGLSAAVSVGVGLFGQSLDRRAGARRFLGRTITAMALAWLYLTAYAACYYEPLRIIHNPVVAGFLLLAWSAYVLLLAERKHSQTLSLFAITLAYVSTALNPVNQFTMTADLILAATAVLFQVRNGWTALSYFSLAGTYLALLRRLVVDENGELTFDSSRALPFSFWPHAVYLVGAWIIFTAAVIFSTAPAFRGGKRLSFLSLNNGAWAGLLLLTAYVSGYGHSPMGWILLATGLTLLITSRLVACVQIEPEPVMAAYAAQGLALFTAGIVVLFTGVTRGFLLMLETLFLGLAALFSGDRILIATTHASGFFATLFLIWEIAGNGHHPWLLGLGGATVLLLNAWWARNEIRHSPKARETVVLSSSYYCILALGLIFTAMNTALSDNVLPPALAVTALALTFLIYFVALYELPPVAQTFLLSAQAFVLFPAETGVELPWWTPAWVAVVTLAMLTWWTRQRVTRTGSWTVVLNLVYALALAWLAYQTVRPWVDPQRWMVTASLLSLAFLVWGAFTRVWPIAVVGQLFLAVVLDHFFFPPGGSNHFPWTWWAAAIPLVVVFSTAHAAHNWLNLSPEPPSERRTALRTLAYGYQLLALAMLIRWVWALVPPLDQVATFLFLGTLVLSWNVRHPSAFGVRCSFVLSLTGLMLYVENLQDNAHAMATFLNGLAFFVFLLQPSFLRPGNKTISRSETWALILLSVAAGGLFVSAWVETRGSPGDLTMSWALYAFFLFLFGRVASERRLTWCGYGILLAAIIRVGFVDFWGLSNGYKILTFIVLTLITLGLGYFTLRSSERTKPL